MPRLVIETFILAPPAQCFDAARDISLHCRTMAHTQERAVAGVTNGRIELGESVTFEGVHFGVRQRLSARITHMERPHFFVDEMTRGAFAELSHRHEFVAHEGGTLMRDIVRWRSPLWWLGTLADALFLRRSMKQLLRRRGRNLKAILENSEYSA